MPAVRSAGALAAAALLLPAIAFASQPALATPDVSTGPARVTTTVDASGFPRFAYEVASCADRVHALNLRVVATGYPTLPNPGTLSRPTGDPACPERAVLRGAWESEAALVAPPERCLLVAGTVRIDATVAFDVAEACGGAAPA